jgi:hypothetical protein
MSSGYYMCVESNRFFFCGATAQIGPRPPLEVLGHTQLDAHTP